VKRTSAQSRGFTMVEMAVVLAIIAVLTAGGYIAISRQRPRSYLANTAADVHALLHGARLTAMANGHNVVVMVFPDLNTPGGGRGRLVLYEDGAFNFFSNAAPAGENLDSYDPTLRRAGANSVVLEVLDLPRDVRVGPTTGMGATAVLTAPLDGIAVNVACGFCRAGGDRRGAILFDPRGRAWFYAQNGAPMALTQGASFSFFSPLIPGSRTVVITNATGAVRTFNNG